MSLPDPKLRSDYSLLRQFVGGEVDAATELYARYAVRLLELAKHRTGVELGHRVDPEDVVQSVFRTFFRRVSEGSYQVPNGNTLWKLLMVIALNKIRSLADFHRADKRDVRRTQPIIETLPADHEQNALNVLQLTIDELTSQLTESHQQMIRMRIEGYGVDEIATKVQRSKRTTERVLQAFRERLFVIIHECGVKLEGDDGDKDIAENEFSGLD